MTRIRASRLSIWRGDTLRLRLTGLGNITSRDDLYFTFKKYSGDTDAQAQIQVSESGGLLYIDGGTATTAANGSITVLSASRGVVEIAVAAEETAKLENDFLGYADLQIYTPTGIDTIWYANAQVVGDTTRDVTGGGLVTLGAWYTGPWPAPYDGVTPIDLADIRVAYQFAWGTGTIYERFDAANKSNALVNLADPGTDDATEAVSTPWSAANGFEFDGTGYLMTIVPNREDSGFAQFTDAVDGFFYLFGMRDAAVAALFYVSQNGYAGGASYGIGSGVGGGSLFIPPGLAAGNFGVHNGYGYRNGTIDIPQLDPFTNDPVGAITIGRLTFEGTPGTQLFTGNMRAFIVLSSVTDAQVEALTAAMAVI